MALSPTSSHGSGSSSSGMALLYDYEVTGSVKASIDTNVDGTLAGLLSGAYKVLQIFMYARTDEAVAGSSGVTVIFNNDSGANYDRQTLSAANVTVTAGSVVAQTSLSTSAVGASGGASMFAPIRIDIPNYAGTVGFKSMLLADGIPQTTAANQSYLPQMWNYRSASAITRVKFTPAVGNFAIGTRLLIFGT